MFGSLVGLILVATGADPRVASLAPIDQLAEQFWSWRAVTQPITPDDIPRIDRPAGWVPDWSRAAVAARREALARFEARWKSIDTTGWEVSRQVDYRLVGSALARVRWELDRNPLWRRDPNFYLQQSVGAVFDLLVVPPPFDRARSNEVVARLGNIPRIVDQAIGNLDQARRPFAELAIAELATLSDRLGMATRDVASTLDESTRDQLPVLTETAGVALGRFRHWLQRRLPSMTTGTAVGPDGYQWFLTHVALVPYPANELLRIGGQEWERAVAFEHYETIRNRNQPELPIFPTLEAEVAGQAADELAVRRFLDDNNILTVPGWVRHYRNARLPAYLAPLASFGVPDDLTGPARLDQDGVHYIVDPSPGLSYFNLSMAKEPRAIIVHEGIPGHYLQLVLGWAHENPIRRHYYDSGANEGIGFYAEEMMLQAGLFDDRPKSREIIYNFMRLRALRVEVDVKLATGQFSIREAADYLHRTVPMDEETALSEAASFAAGPGLAITYQVGKRQILRMLADQKRQLGNRFDLRAFHDFVWKNGNIPLALVRWELLGQRDEIDAIDKSAARPLRSPRTR